MPTKLDYERIFNKLWGVNIKWRKLSKEELATLAAIWANPEVIAKRLGLDKSEGRANPRDMLIRALLSLAKEWEGPIMSMLRDLGLFEEGKKVK